LPKVYLIAGCNGAGKTTASLTLLPKMLECKEFVNADNIAAGISPFQPDKVAIEAGRLMLKRINDLIDMKIDFAIETTLSSRNYISKINEFQKKDYEVVLIYFWLNTPVLAIERIKERVRKGGHFIPDEIVNRRYYRGINNLLKYFIPLSDYWLVFDNSSQNAALVAEGIKGLEKKIFNDEIWQEINRSYNGK
jgi:predicted ABC-type ATPase